MAFRGRSLNSFKVPTADEISRMIDGAIARGQQPSSDDENGEQDERKHVRTRIIEKGAKEYYQFLLEEVEKGISRMKKTLKKTVTLNSISNYLKGKLTDEDNKRISIPLHAIHYGNQGQMKKGGRIMGNDERKKRWMKRTWLPELGVKSKHPFPKAQNETFKKWKGMYLLEVTSPEKNNKMEFILTCDKNEALRRGKKKLWHGYNVLPKEEDDIVDDYLPEESKEERKIMAKSFNNFKKMTINEDEIEDSDETDSLISDGDFSDSDEESEEEEVHKPLFRSSIPRKSYTEDTDSESEFEESESEEEDEELPQPVRKPSARGRGRGRGGRR